MYRIRQRFSWTVGLAASIFLLGMALVQYLDLRQHIIAEGRGRLREIISQAEAVHAFCRYELRPAVLRIAPPEVFVPEAMSGTYATRRVMEIFTRTNPAYTYKFAAPDPRNPVNRADELELSVIRQFAASPGLTIREEDLEREGRPVLAAFSPLVVENSCLPCHGTPAAAPREIVERYGPARGFHLRVGQVAGVRSVSLPISGPLAAARRMVLTNLLFTLVGVALLIGVIGFSFHRIVSRPVREIETQIAQIGRGDFGHDPPALADNEIGLLGRTLQLMREQVRERTAELEGLLYALSHDLKAPLANIKSMVSLLREGALTVEQERHLLARVDANSDTMLRLITDLLELSRIGIEKEPAQEFAAGEVVDEVLRLHEQKIAARGATVVVAPGLPRVRYPRTGLLQVFSNLVGNALVHTGEQPGLRIEIGCESAGDRHEFRVRDNGPGIAVAEQRRIFEPFHTGTGRKSGASGLGLTIVQRIVGKNGGSVRVESEPGRGAAFVFTVLSRPVTPVAAGNPPARTRANASA